ncbi:MAG: CHRD domain-containing protein [Saprospiraceae bacterium]|nr:CHRD domain-containing protein [Saprospiraceae bacterium]
MKTRITYFLSIFISFCGWSQLVGQNGQLLFVAEMNGDNEIPMVRTDASGLFTFLLSEDLSEIEIHGAFSNITGNITGCHIHVGDRATNGPVFLNLGSFVSGHRIKAKVPTPALFLELATTGGLYVNLHSSVFPGGEIRGQLDWRSELIMPVVLLGANQIPAVPSPGIGLGVLRFSPNLTRVEYQIMPINLTGPPTAAHIHRGDAATNGTVLTDLNAGTFISGTITDQLTVIDLIFSAYDTGVYVNIHTAAYPNGEIRGQVQLPAIFSGNAFLNGDQETPAVATAARGYGYGVLGYPSIDTLFYLVISEGLIATDAHIHQARAGQSGPVVAPLTATGFPGVYTGSTALTPIQLQAFLKDELYFNIHTAANPAGEIRGQIQNNLLDVYAFDLCGDQEVPKKNVPAYGASHVAINKAATELEYTLFSTDLNGDAVSAHIHDAGFGVNGSILIPLDVPNPYAAGVVEIPGTVAAKIRNDGAYVNVHTAANPPGEIRGQIRRALSCAINVGTVQTDISAVQLMQNPVGHMLFLHLESLRNVDSEIVIQDLNGQGLQSWDLNVISGTSKHQFPVEDLKPGFYFLNIKEKGISSHVIKFVKI